MKPYKNYETNEEFDSIPEGMVALGKQPNGTYVIKNSDGSYSKISASDPRATKIASETVEPTHINTKSGIDMYEGKNSTSIDPGNISDYSALFGNSRRNSQIANPYATDLSGSSVSKYISETYFRNNITKDYHIDPNTWDNKPWVSRDYLTTNGGNVGMKIYGETPDQFGVEMFDRWDLQPGSALWSILFKNKIPTPKFVRNWEAGKFLKGEPFDMRTRFVVDKEGMKNINYYDGKIGYITDFE